MYQIKTEQFEGPLDMLLVMIEEKKLDITRFSLAQVADQYLESMQIKSNATLEKMADFLTVASRLILIKSKAILPTLELTEEEEGEIRDLEEQLIQYKKYKEASHKLSAMYASPRRVYSREAFSGMKIFFSPPAGLSVFDLKKAFQRIVDEIPEIVRLEEEMVREVMTLEEKINHLHSVLKKRAEATFSEFAGNAKDKIEVIVSFLAMLELVKQKIIAVEQRGLFSEIKMKTEK